VKPGDRCPLFHGLARLGQDFDTDRGVDWILGARSTGAERHGRKTDFSRVDRGDVAGPRGLYAHL
jgi:hypothetical protein